MKVFCVPDLPFLLLRNLTGEDICSMMLHLLLNLNPDQSGNRKNYDAGDSVKRRGPEAYGARAELREGGGSPFGVAALTWF